MSRPPIVKSHAQAAIAQGRAVAGLVREATTILRRNVELLKQLELSVKDEEDKGAISEYLQDPAVNPTMEKRPDEKMEPKAVTNRDRALAKLMRILQDLTEDELEWHMRIFKATKKGPLKGDLAPAVSKTVQAAPNHGVLKERVA